MATHPDSFVIRLTVTLKSIVFSTSGMTLIVAACGWIFCPSLVSSIRSFLVGVRAELGRSFRLLQGSDALMQPFTRPSEIEKKKIKNRRILILGLARPNPAQNHLDGIWNFTTFLVKNFKISKKTRQMKTGIKLSKTKPLKLQY